MQNIDGSVGVPLLDDAGYINFTGSYTMPVSKIIIALHARN
jgi:hypothetical protein